MESKLCKLSKLFIAAGCLSTLPAGFAQTSGTNTALEDHVEYATTDFADNSGEGAAPAAAPAPSAPAPAPAAVRTEVIPSATLSTADIRPALTMELEAMKLRIAELEKELSTSSAANSSDAAKALEDEKYNLLSGDAPQSSETQPAAPELAAKAAPADLAAEVTTRTVPFAYADWTWLNGNPRTKDTPLATRYFTPEFRADVNYTLDFNHPKDDSLGGSTETFRSGEVQVEQLSFGGDIRIENVRGRFLTMNGLFATTTPRNDASVNRGQWDLGNAYRYVSEAWGGYHWDVQHGLNLDAGIFVSYIGLFSYYNFDNWTYQPSYVSSNTPWFFNGVRAQWFPTDKLKIEPWFVNGWQSYAKFNGRPGLGGQILYRPKPWVSLVFNNYGLGEDAPGVPNRSRLHTDNSIQIKYYDKPDKFIDKAAFSFTGDLGCEFGGGVSCTGKGGNPKQAFLGYMFYDRTWFKKDLYAFTLGGGQLNNPGRYLVLIPPINGATAVSGTPYYTENPGQGYHAKDITTTFDYMPSQFITFRAEMGYRHADQPYWTGRGGITPPGGNNGSPANYACNSGASAGTNILATAQIACAVGGSTVWFPDLRRSQIVSTVAIMVKF